MICIRTLTPEDAAAWWALRLEALECEPLAFGKTVEEHRAMSIETVAERIADLGPQSFYLGAFEDEAMVAMATYIRSAGVKDGHKGFVYGVYVTGSHRGQGLGRRLLSDLISRARRDPSLEQLLLAVATTNEPARRLYEELGFKTFGVEPRALKLGPNAYVDEEHRILDFRCGN